MRPVCWNIITQIVRKHARDTLIPKILLNDNKTNKAFEHSCVLPQWCTGCEIIYVIIYR